MRLSFVSLIAAALAAIGNAIAAPGPLRARALEDVNSFSVYSHKSGLAPLEHKVDVEFVDDLSIRTTEDAIAARKAAAKAYKTAAKKAAKASGTAWEASKGARKAALKASVIADQLRVIADQARLLSAGSQASEQWKNVATDYDNSATHYNEEADRHNEEAGHYRHQVGCHIMEKTLRTKEKKRHKEAAEKHRKIKSKNWKRSMDHANECGRQAGENDRASQKAIDGYDAAIGRDQVTIAEYNDLIGKNGAIIDHHQHAIDPHWGSRHHPVGH